MPLAQHWTLERIALMHRSLSLVGCGTDGLKHRQKELRGENKASLAVLANLKHANYRQDQSGHVRALSGTGGHCFMPRFGQESPATGKC